MNVYTDCTGIPFAFQNEIINITGNPLPTNGIVSIVMKPDSNSYTNSGQGNTSPSCTNAYGAPYSCNNQDLGTVRRYPFQSDPITLTGVPPVSGWSFNYEPSCCRPGSFQNINSTGAMLLRSTMFQLTVNDSVDTCYDSSPQFAEIPNYLFCRGLNSTLNNRALDNDIDSMVYKLAQTFNGPRTNPIPLTFKPGYSLNNPTPDTSFDLRNIPYSLDLKSGDIQFAIYNGTGYAQYHLNSVVESWRNGVKIASVSREIPIGVQDCPSLPSGNTNYPPQFAKPFITSGGASYSTTVVAGTYLSIPIVISDTNTTGIGNGQQTITMIPFGESISTSYTNSNLCLNPNDTSCATFNITPTLNALTSPPRFEYRGQSNISLNLNWQTDCNHLAANGGAKTHYFLIKSIDDHCPIPAMTYQSIAVTVLPSTNNCNLITGIEDESITFSEELSMYPNPTNGRVSIATQENEESLEVLVRNIQGQLINRMNYNNVSRIDFDINGESGIYFIELINTTGERANLKVIKQ